MDKAELKQALTQNHRLFIAYIQQLSDEDFERQPHEKWSAGQHLAHIFRAVQPVQFAMGLPTWVIRFVGGVNNRTPKTYAELIEKYLHKIAEGAKATGRFIPPPISIAQKLYLIQKLEQQVIKLNNHLERWTEHDLDRLVLPHPILGKLTLREMLYFTIYHVEHHERISKRDLKS